MPSCRHFGTCDLCDPDKKPVNPYKYIDDVKLAQAMGLAGPRARKAHIHTLNGRPIVGGSTMKGIVGNKDNLMQWHADMCAIAGLTSGTKGLPPGYENLKADYDAVQAISDWKKKANAKKALDDKYPLYAEARRAAVAHRDSAAVDGTARHATLQDYIRECLESNGRRPKDVNREFRNKDGTLVWTKEILAFIDWALAEVDEFYFTEVHAYHENLGGIPVGGIVDAGMKLKSGKRVIGDHKRSKDVYQDQFLQCSIYDRLLMFSGGLDRDGNKLFDWAPADGYVVFPFRSEPFTPEFRWNADQFRECVEANAKLYKLIEL